MKQSSDPRDTIALILAAGAGSRLAPVMQPYQKPLRVIGGRPLVCHSVRFAMEFEPTARVRVVVSPNNVEAIDAALYGESPGRIQLIQQTDATGPLDAVRLGLEGLEDAVPVLLLCSDNTFDPDGAWFRNIVRWAGGQAVIGVRPAAPDPRGLYSKVIGNRITEKSPDDYFDHRWIGPVWFPSLTLLREGTRHADTLEDAMRFAAAGGGFEPAWMNCRDHGTLP
jgi:NDP-sugar pyrophosphorylase family protein